MYCPNDMLLDIMRFFVFNMNITPANIPAFTNKVQKIHESMFIVQIDTFVMILHAESMFNLLVSIKTKTKQ